MNEAITKVSGPVFIFLLGYLLKRFGLIKKEDGDLFFKLIFYIVVPALYLTSIPSLKLSLNLFYLPLLVLVVVSLTFIVSWIVAKLLGLQRLSFGVFLVSTMIMNTAILFPFFLGLYGTEGVAKLALVDSINGLVVFSFIYLIAVKYGAGKLDRKIFSQKLILAPPIWAAVLALGLNFSKVQLPPIAVNFLQLLAVLITPLIMLSLGSYFSLKVIKVWKVLPALFIRFGFGLLIGVLFSLIFNLEGLVRITVILASGAPIGYNTLTFSSLEKLDTEYAASIVSFSMLAGIIIVPLLFLFIK